MIKSPVFGVIIVVLLAAWLGASLITSAVVAPAAFAVLPTRTLAGALVGRVLPVLFWTCVALGISVVLASFRASPTATGAGVVMTLGAVVALFLINPRIEAIRNTIGGPIDGLDPSDPRRQAFGRLHGFSVLSLGVAGLAAGVALMIVARYLAQRSAA